MKIFDDIFDKRFHDEFTNKLRYANWYPTNISNRTTWPYGEKGTHRLLGDVLFKRKSNFVSFVLVRSLSHISFFLNGGIIQGELY